MSDFRRNGGFGGGDRRGGGRDDRRSGGFGGKPNFRSGGGDRGERKEMFDAVCTDCKKPCQVPFRPSGDKPVLCRDCFQEERGTNGESFRQKGNDSGRDNRGSDRFPKKEFSSPSVFRQGGDDKVMEQMKKQLESINVKLDKMVQLMINSSTKNSSADKKEDKKEDTLKNIVEKAVTPAKKEVKGKVEKKGKKEVKKVSKKK